MASSKDLECPVCLEVPKEGNIYQCKNGHIFCEICQAKLIVEKQPCPICRVDLGNEPIRCLVAENFVKGLFFPCKNANVGCTFKRPMVS